MRELLQWRVDEEVSFAAWMMQAASTREPLFALVRKHTHTHSHSHKQCCDWSIIRFWLCLKTQGRHTNERRYFICMASRTHCGGRRSTLAVARQYRTTQYLSYYRIKEISHEEYAIFYVSAVVRLGIFFSLLLHARRVVCLVLQTSEPPRL